MKFDVNLLAVNLQDTPELARRTEAIGAAGLWTAEAQNNPFLPLALAAEHTRQLELGTAIAVAFGRSPLDIAHTAWDLAAQSEGRFILGLGTQVKPHIEKRFSMPWPDSVVGKLRETIIAIRAIWHSWQTGERLNHRGEYFRHTLMTPFFSPGPIPQPDIPIYIAGVNRALIRLAGEVADGLHVHPFHTLRYLREVVLPNIARGAERSGRAPKACALSSSAFVAIGNDENSRAPLREMMRTQIAFYASTPSYHIVMDLHGWGAVAAQLSGHARRNRWDEMTALISDEMLAEFVIEGTWDDIGDKLRARYDGLLNRVGLLCTLHAGRIARQLGQGSGGDTCLVCNTSPVE